MKALALKTWMRIDSQHPLYKHLASVVLPLAGIDLKDPHIETAPLSDRQAVYLFKELKSRNHFVGKHFGFRYQLSEQECRNVLNKEFLNLCAIRAKGFSDYPNRVVRPYTKNEEMDYLLVQDYIRGHDLDYYIIKAAYSGQHEQLLRKLAGLAYFLFMLHQTTTSDHSVCIKNSSGYFRSIIECLKGQGIIDEKVSLEFEHLFNVWERSDKMQQDISVWVHGDVTPTNFFFHPEDGITAIDLERMQLADRVYDIGFLCAELKHHFALRLLNANLAERFITHFLHAYCENFSDPYSEFKSIAERNPFYMALGEMRIARNSYLPQNHRSWLVEEAYRCLTY
jgi:aminoglycoside phosphotransferase (APT) family kinase protein